MGGSINVDIREKSWFCDRVSEVDFSAYCAAVAVTVAAARAGKRPEFERLIRPTQ